MKCAGCLFAAILALSSFGALDARAAEKPRLVVFMIESRGSGLKGDEVRSLTDYLASQMVKNGRYQVLPLPKPGKRTTDTSPIKLAGGPPDFVLSSSIHRVGNQCLLMAGLYDPRAATMNQAVTGRMPCRSEAFITGIEQMAQELSTGNPLPTSVPVVAVFLMESRRCDLSADETVGLTEYLAARLVERRALRLTPRDSLFKQIATLQKTKRQAPIYSISSKVGRVDDQCLMSFQFFDMRHGTMLGSVVGRCASDSDRLIEGVEALAQQLADKFRAFENPAKGKRLVPHPVVPAKATPPAPTKASSAP
ncbi:MAG: hypothetical protein JRF33_16770 [Deltaproteobacteria bacterium]|nr:hypothetical protein [Deltaproteobacteria bacterium]